MSQREAMTDEEADALLNAGNERLRIETECLRHESTFLTRQTERIREQNRILQVRLERKRRLAEHLAVELSRRQNP